MKNLEMKNFEVMDLTSEEIKNVDGGRNFYEVAIAIGMSLVDNWSDFTSGFKAGLKK
jgi:lactobin A/cerein 7B family class IIb bacteriocin